jgi:hypothetical protein
VLEQIIFETDKNRVAPGLLATSTPAELTIDPGLSWRFVPITYSPLYAATTESRNLSSFPPSLISTPRPAMFVEMVISPGIPASAMMLASDSSFLALRTAHLIRQPGDLPQFFRFLDIGRADRMGLSSVHCVDFLTMARRFASGV